MLRNITSLLFCYLTTEQREKLYIEEYKSFQCFTFSTDYDFIATYIYIYILFVSKRDTKTARKDFLIRNEGSDFSNRNSRTIFLSYFVSLLSLNSNLNIRFQINPAINSIELLLDLSINELEINSTANYVILYLLFISYRSLEKVWKYFRRNVANYLEEK